MIKNKDSLKAKVNNISKEYNIPNKYLIQDYMFEEILKRISYSKYKDNFIIKGGLLLASIFGVNLRSTMDMDTTIKGIALTKENITEVLNNILNIDIKDNIKFELISIKDIRDENLYNGYRVHINANFEGLKCNLLIDITTGDVITYSEIQYSYKPLFDNERINIMAYNYETIIAEKFHSIIVLNVDNTRMKDYYDIHMFVQLKWNELNKDTLKVAIMNTAESRNTEEYINHSNEYISLIESDNEMKNMWEKYRNNFPYAGNIKFDEIIESIKKINNVFISNK